MSKSGTYKVIDGEVVKVSDKVPSLRPPVFLKSDGEFIEEFATKEHPKGQWVANKDEKRRILDDLHLAEV